MAETLLAGIALLCLVTYALTGGADFGGGVWDLFAVGGRGRAQREAIAKAIGPIWEANHVWLIIVIVILFVGFPKTYATIGTALHVPLTLTLVGIVLRGTAFVFRHYDSRKDRVQLQWSLVFAVSSLLTPIAFGMCVAALITGDIRRNAETGLIETNFLTNWLGWFPLSVGLFTLALFAFLAAVYMAHIVRYAPLREDFRRRALISGLATGVFAFLSLGLSYVYAPVVWEGLTSRWWSWPFQIGTGVAAVAALYFLMVRRWLAARIAAMAQVSLVILGWGASIYPYMVVPDLTIANAHGPENVIWMMVIALSGGMFILVPSFVLLYRIFWSAAAELGPE